MTERCNLACKYCYLSDMRNHTPELRTIDVNFAKCGIDDFFIENEPALRFFGSGEPTVAFNEMKELWDYAFEKAGRNLYTEIQTNGFFNAKVREWIADHIDMVWISCDGYPEIQDYHRPTVAGTRSSHVVAENIRKLAEAGKTVGIRSTIGAVNLDKQKAMIYYFHSMGVKAVFADHLCVGVSQDAPERYKDILVEVPPLEYAKAFLEAKEYADKLGLFYSNFLTVNFDEPVNIACRAMLPVPHLTPAGLVSCCDMVAEKTGTVMDELIYGEYDPALGMIIYDEDKIDKIRTRRRTRLPECLYCPIESHCVGGCVGEAINETGNFYGVKKNLCEATKYLACKLGVDYKERFPYLHP